MKFSAGLFLTLLSVAFFANGATAHKKDSCELVTKSTKKHQQHAKHQLHSSAKSHHHEEIHPKANSTGYHSSSKWDGETKHNNAGELNNDVDNGSGNDSGQKTTKQEDQPEGDKWGPQKTSPKGSHSSSKAHPLTPNNKKAGLAGGEALDQFKGKIGFMTTWTANPYPGTDLGNVNFATMCYGFGESGNPDDGKRFEEFKKVKIGKYPYVIGGNELDFQGGASAGLVKPERAAELWDKWIAPHGNEGGSVLISPSCATQLDEHWMGPFLKAVKTQPDIVNVHAFSDKASDIKKVLDHYRQYGKPMWVTEFACINFNKHKECSKEETVQFIYEVVKMFEEDDDVMAYSYADAENGPNCHLSHGNSLTASGSAYANAIAQFTKRDSGFEVRRGLNHSATHFTD